MSNKNPIEGLHYYIENDLMVFTEYFHINRGSCCGKICRHCPYDPINIKGNKNIREDLKNNKNENTAS